MVVEDVGSSQGESAILVTGIGEREVSRNPLDVPVEMLETSEEEARLANPVSLRNGTVSVAADLVLRSFVPHGDARKEGDHPPMPREAANLEVAEMEEYVDVVGSSNPVPCGVNSEWFTLKVSVSHAFLHNSCGDLDTSGFPKCKFLFHLVFTVFFLYRLTFWPLCVFLI